MPGVRDHGEQQLCGGQRRGPDGALSERRRGCRRRGTGKRFRAQRHQGGAVSRR